MYVFTYFRERGRGEREKYQFVVPLIYVFIGCLLYEPSPGTELMMLTYEDDALSN